MRIQPPSENILRINRALLEKPRKPVTLEDARNQVKEHLSQAQAELLRHGHGKKES